MSSKIATLTELQSLGGSGTIPSGQSLKGARYDECSTYSVTGPSGYSNNELVPLNRCSPLGTYNQTLVLINDGWGDCKISRDGGASWTILYHSHFNCVDVSADGNYILLGESAIDGAAGRVLLSTDNGQSFSTVSSGRYTTEVTLNIVGSSLYEYYFMDYNDGLYRGMGTGSPSLIYSCYHYQRAEGQRQVQRSETRTPGQFIISPDNASADDPYSVDYNYQGAMYSVTVSDRVTLVTMSAKYQQYFFTTYSDSTQSGKLWKISGAGASPTVILQPESNSGWMGVYCNYSCSVLVVTCNSTGIVYISRDAGGSFTQALNNIGSIRFPRCSEDGRTITIATDDGTQYISRDYGATWTGHNWSSNSTTGSVRMIACSNIN